METIIHHRTCDMRLFHGRVPCNQDCGMPEIDRLRRDIAILRGRYQELCGERDDLKRALQAEHDKWRRLSS